MNFSVEHLGLLRKVDPLAVVGEGHDNGVRGQVAGPDRDGGARAGVLLRVCGEVCQDLPDAPPVVGREREAERERRGVGLEVAVRPVAVVLELEQVPVEGHDRLEPGADLDGDGLVRGEHARERPRYKP